MTPEQALWSAVIERALLDGCGLFGTYNGKTGPADRARLRDQGRAFFARTTEFALACDAAGLEPGWVLTVARKAFAAVDSGRPPEGLAAAMRRSEAAAVGQAARERRRIARLELVRMTASEAAA